MSLTDQQKQEVDADLEKKATLIEWRDHNRREVVNLKQLLSEEEAKPESLELCCDLRHDIRLGNELVEKQTSALMNLSITMIAKRVNADVESVIYYEKASLHTERRPAVR